MRTSAFAIPGIGLVSQLSTALSNYHSPSLHNGLSGPPPTSSEHDTLGAVASESSICSNIGTSILRAGGNAADSMIATVACVGVIGMYHSGIGGGGFMLVRGSDGLYEFIDFRESAPAAAYQDMYANNTLGSVYGGLAAGVPSELKGLKYLYENYGSLPWEDLILPAVKVAREGFEVSHDLIRYMTAATAGKRNFLVEDPSWAIDFAPKGRLVQLGETITRKRYANTLETIAYQGPDAFFEGPIAEATIEAIQSTGGTMTLDDLRDYEVAIRDTAAIDYRGYKIYSGGAPSSGTVGLSVMKIIEGFEEIGQAATLNLSTHLFDEALRFAYGQRSEMGDPDFVSGMEEYEANMLNDTTAASLRAKISPLHTLNVSAYDPSGFEIQESHGTSAVVTADASGMAITLTTTINLLFGNELMVPKTGVILNNEMNDFSIPGKRNAFGYAPSPSNYIRAGKRSLSSITPAIVEFANGTLYHVVAAAGGSRIITATLHSLWHVLDHNMTAPEALAAPRLHDQLIPNQVTFEYTYDNDTVAFMKSRGHNVTWVPLGVSAVQSLRRLSNRTFEAAAEPRQRNSGGYAV